MIRPIQKSTESLCVQAKFLGGFAGGGTLVVIPVYVTEIAEDK